MQVCCLRPISPSSGKTSTARMSSIRSGPRRLRHEPFFRHLCAPGRPLHRHRGRSCRSRSLHAERIPKTQLLDAMLSSTARRSSARPRRPLAFDSTPPNLRLEHSPVPRMAGLYGPARASAQPVRPPAGRLTARRPGMRRGDVTAGEVTSPPGDPHCTRYRLCRCAASVRVTSCRQPSRGVGPPTVSRHEVSTVQVCCLRPVVPSVTPTSCP